MEEKAFLLPPSNARRVAPYFTGKKHPSSLFPILIKRNWWGVKKRRKGEKSASFSYSGYISASHVCFFHYKTSFPLSFLQAKAAAAALPQTFHQGKEGEERWEMGQTVPDLWLLGDRNVLGLGDKCMAAGMPWHREDRTAVKEDANTQS